MHANINALLSNCPNLSKQNVKELSLLKCVHVFDKGVEEKLFSLHCDHESSRLKYAGEEEAVSCPRFSGVKYTVQGSNTQYDGQVVGIVSYKRNIADGHNQIFLFINRLVEVDDNIYFKRKLPHRLMKYENIYERITTDTIHVSRICGPLFLVPALDQGMKMSDCGDSSHKKAHYYVLDEMKVKCHNIIQYVDYLDRNNTFYTSSRYRSSKQRHMNLNCYLTVTEMNMVKEMVNVHRNGTDSDGTDSDDEGLEVVEFDDEEFD